MLATQRAVLTSHKAHDAHLHTLKGSVHLFLQPAILLCFGYFVFQTIAGTGLQTQGTMALNVTFGVPLALAASAISAYLLGSTAGILAGGFLAARTTHHDRVAAAGLAAGALLIGIVGTGVVASRCCSRCSRRSASRSARRARRAISSCATRRRAAPRGASTASSIRASTSARRSRPVWFGAMLDHGLGRGMFFAAAAVLLVAIGTVTRIRRARRPRAT